ncbi:MAG: sodium/proline symporter [Marivibrio sp.]|uniref:sodium/proline symporter n=1 Tax=Marivibrio sp. TaxID=2039719 RepID=UPI0032EF6210
MASVILSFLFFLLLFAAIGALSIRRKRSRVDDYLLAGRSVSPWLTGLSSVVTNNSGYMFIGLIGFTYTHGISAVWLMIGWLVGDAIAWMTVHPRLRRASETSLSQTVGGLIAEAVDGPARPVAIALALVTIAFLATYAAAQFNAGGKALQVMFHWRLEAGAVIGAGLVLLYSYAGGIRASIWTDAAQSAVMLSAMLALLVLCLLEIGGAGPLVAALHAQDPALVDPIPPDLRFGFGLFAFGWVMAGLGVAGQPHILIRTMALESAREIWIARSVYFGWYVPFATAAVLVALSARVLMPDAGSFDAELALPLLAQELMPGVLVGLVLASIFAATISTADSQLLSCSAAITQDLFPGVGQSYAMVKLGTAAVTAAALGVVLLAPSNVFNLVIIAWSGLAAGIGPLMVVRLFGGRVRTGVALAMIAGGVGTVALWRFALGFSADVYEVAPGAAAAFAIYAVGRLIAPAARKSALQETG